MSGCVEVNSIRVCQNDEVPVLTQHDVFSKSFDSSKGHTCSNVSSVEEGTNFQDNNNKVVFKCHVPQRFEENSIVSSKEIQVLPAEANMCVLSELRPCTTEPVIHVSKPNLQESVVFYTVLETEFTDTDVVQSPCTFIEPVAFCHELHVETATSCVLDSKFCATCHSPETAVNSDVNSDKVHANVMHPSSHIHRETRGVSENPGVSQVKLFHFLLRILCSYYGTDTLKKNLLSFLGAKNTRVKQAIGVSIPSAHCSEDDQNCLKEIESSVQKVDLQKADTDPTKFTTGNLPVCSDVSDDHLLTSKVKVDCLNDVSEVNNRFIALVTQDTLPLSRDTNNISVNGTVCDTELTFLVDTGANVTAIKADVWRQIPPSTKHPPSPTTISYMKSVSGESIPVLGQAEVPFYINSRSYPFKALLIEAMAYDAILGRDFLEFYKAKIDLERHTLTLEGDSSPLVEFDLDTNTDHSEPRVFAVHAQSSFIIPPSSEIIVPGGLDFSCAAASTAFLQPRPELPERYQIIGAAQLVKVSNNNSIPVRLLNPTSQPVHIYRRTKLAEISIVNPEIATYELVRSDVEAEANRDIATAVDVEPRVPLDVGNTGLTQEKRTRLQALLTQYDDIFAYTPDQLGRCSVVKHRIDTGHHPPVRLRSYRTSPANKEEIDRQIQEMLQNDIISPSVSPWSSSVVLVKKSDGTMRFCIDYRKLNQITRKDSHPLPRIPEALDSLGRAHYFSTLDLRSGYWQIEMADDSKEKTAFITHNGLYEFNALPFGLCNSPATFQRVMTHVLRGLEWDICLVYIDDLIIFSRTFDDHLLHLEQVFKRLREANLRLKPSKCHFVKSEVEYLGHVVSADGLKPNPAKIRAVQEFPVPTNVTGVKAFLGLCNYYRRFIKGFAQIASPLNKLTSKNIKFDWAPEC